MEKRCGFDVTKPNTEETSQNLRYKDVTMKKEVSSEMKSQKSKLRSQSFKEKKVESWENQLKSHRK